MKIRFFIPLLFAIASVAMTSCKDDDDKPSAKSKQLTGKEWTLTKIVRNTVDVTEDELSECDADDSMVFNTNGTFLESVGELICDEEEDYDGTWSWKSNETILTIKYTDGAPYDWTLKQLTDTILEIENYDADDEETTILTFTKK